MRPVNPERGEVWLQTDDEGGVVLRLGFAEMRYIENLSGLSLPDFGKRLQERNAFGDLSVVLTAAMQGARPGATQADADMIADKVGPDALAEAIGLCFARSEFLNKGKGRRPPEAAAGGTGESS